METFNIGLNVAGDIQFVMNIPAKNFKQAVLSWAHWTGHLDNLYNHKNQTYFGWPIVKTNEKALQRKSELNSNSFHY